MSGYYLNSAIRLETRRFRASAKKALIFDFFGGKNMNSKPFEKYYKALDNIEKELASLKKSTEEIKKKLDEKEKSYREKYHF